MQDHSILRAALSYTRRGLFVHPLVAREKRPILDDWPNACSTDEARITSWWEQWPESNVGIVTGEKSGVTLLDFDTQETVDDWLNFCEVFLGGEPETVTALTPGGGRHYYFAYTPHLRTGAAVVKKGWDVRNDGGYAAAAPSIHPNGGTYQWLRAPDEVPFLELPQAVIDLYLEAMKRERSNVRAKQGPIPVGQQETTLTKLAGAMLRQGASLEEIQAALLEAANRCDPPMAERDALRIANSIGSRPAEDPFFVLETDKLGLVMRFVVHARDRLRYVDERKCWAAFTGKRWVMEADLVAQDRWVEFVEAFIAIVETLPEDTDEELVYKETMRGFAYKGRELRTIETGIKMARAPMRISIEEFDTHPWLFNCDNGTIDLQTGELRAHDPADLITKISPVAYVPERRSEEWEGLLSLVTDHNHQLVEYLQTASGFTMSGEANEQLLFVLYGRGATGKSTFISLIRHVFGTYSSVASSGSFLKRASKGGANPALAKTVGARLVSGVEIEFGEQLDAALIKSVTGNETISTRELYGKEFQFDPQFTMWLVSNDLPEVAGDSAIFRRLKVVPFDHVIPKEERDIDFLRRVLGSPRDLEAILAWCVQGCLKWQKHGIIEPEVVTTATREYEEITNPVATFIEEECHRDPDADVEIGEAWQAYREWARLHGIEAGKDSRKLTHGLLQLGLKIVKRGPRGHQVRHYAGFKLRQSLKGRTTEHPGTFESMLDN